MSQPLVFDDDKKRFNLRKLSELPYHLVNAKRLKEVREDVLTDFEWLLAKIGATSPAELIADFDAVVPAVPQSRLGSDTFTEREETLF